MEEFSIRSQTHTLACLIRHFLFENGATFASCTVPHPLDTDLLVKIESASGGKECLLAALRDSRREVEAAIRTIDAYKAHVAASMETD